MALACPSQSPTAFTDTPRESRVEAKVWRKAWYRSPGTPASRHQDRGASGAGHPPDPAALRGDHLHLPGLRRNTTDVAERSSTLYDRRSRLLRTRIAMAGGWPTGATTRPSGDLRSWCGRHPVRMGTQPAERR